MNWINSEGKMRRHEIMSGFIEMRKVNFDLTKSQKTFHHLLKDLSNVFISREFKNKEISIMFHFKK
ncbi:CLUMA_CG007026, isoform A [Clunio marinus]|uniref:CLUMA_CG007026, isoform A n=1 Tax=Clunio marinus TaxID=568069 RepID=A0A1J1I157_9DIPT|nr:CLUMA_CG007026, isoform A [Clunio marinus]